MKIVLVFSLTIILFSFLACGGAAKQANDSKVVTDSLVAEQQYIKADAYETRAGELKVTLVGHGSLMFEYQGKIIHVDPYSQVADYSKLPKADLLLITHEHGDHLDTAAISAIWKENTVLYTTTMVHDILGYGNVLNNSDDAVWSGIQISAVPAYNIENKKPDGEAYHPKGRGNGYVMTFDDKKVYIAGDTENIPEMDGLKGQIDISFMPKNLPYTMTDDMFIDAVKKVEPKVVYPYHMSEFNQDKIGKALESIKTKIEVRPMKNL